MKFDPHTANLKKGITAYLRDLYRKTGVRSPVPWRTVMMELGATEEDLLKALQAESDKRRARADIVVLDRDHIVLGPRWIVKNFRYRINRKVRRIAKSILRPVVNSSSAVLFDIDKEAIHKILLVRANFRMGNTVLAAPALVSFRKQFPDATIDFVGAPLARTLFRNLPIDRHISITRRFPDASWIYPALMRRIRSTGYDLAVDLSCSQSALGAFIVGFSKARFRVGLRGEWGRWCNVRIPRPRERNKYKSLPGLLEAMGLKAESFVPLLSVSEAERKEGRKKIRSSSRYPGRSVVGIFVGGRKTMDKRWPVENFCQVITALHRQQINVVIFFGPEEQELIAPFRDALDGTISFISEPSSAKFAALVSNCDLFVTCDSGPMHLACALGIRVVAIFQKENFARWGPPSNVARIVYRPGGCSAAEVLKACELELSSCTGRSPLATARLLAMISTLAGPLLLNTIAPFQLILDTL